MSTGAAHGARVGDGRAQGGRPVVFGDAQLEDLTARPLTTRSSRTSRSRPVTVPRRIGTHHRTDRDRSALALAQPLPLHTVTISLLLLSPWPRRGREE